MTKRKTPSAKTRAAKPHGAKSAPGHKSAVAREPADEQTSEDQISYSALSLHDLFQQQTRQMLARTDLNEEEKQVYRDELEKVVVVIEDKALDAYKSGYARALQIGVYNKHTQKIHEALSRLAENEYPKEAELRASIRVGEPRVGLEKIEEVRRDQ